MADDTHPVIQEGGDLQITQTGTLDSSSGKLKGPLIWYHVAGDDELSAGKTDGDWEGDWDNLDTGDFWAQLKPVSDHVFYPELPVDLTPPLTIAPDNMDEGVGYIKRPNFAACFPDPSNKQMKGDEGQRVLRAEMLVLERLSYPQAHPYIVRYLGCRVRRGRITGIVLEALKWNLTEYAVQCPSKFAVLDKESFLDGLESAVLYMHSLGLAHNDINPNNVMVREADDGSCSPALIDFGSTGPFGEMLLCAGTPGFSESGDPEAYVSLKRHDEFSLGCMREWWDKTREAAQQAAARDDPVEEEWRAQNAT